MIGGNEPLLAVAGFVDASAVLPLKFADATGEAVMRHRRLYSTAFGRNAERVRTSRMCQSGSHDLALPRLRVNWLRVRLRVWLSSLCQRDRFRLGLARSPSPTRPRAHARLPDTALHPLARGFLHAAAPHRRRNPRRLMRQTCRMLRVRLEPRTGLRLKRRPASSFPASQPCRLASGGFHTSVYPAAIAAPDTHQTASAAATARTHITCFS